MASWGLLGTAVAFGAKGWRDEYGEALAGRTVIIIPDNDEPGREFAERASRSIEHGGGMPRILVLPDLPSKGDIMDWTGTAEDLQALVAKPAKLNAEIFPIADLQSWQTTPATPKGFIMPGFVPEHELTLATGAGGANKSTFGQQLATCCAAGVPMLGVDVRQGSTSRCPTRRGFPY